MLSVLTLNIHGQRDRWLGRRELLLAGILRDLPDFILFQNVNTAGRQVNWLVRQLNARWGNQLYYWTQLGRRGLFQSFARGGVAVLSRLPILWEERIELGEGYLGMLANIELPLGRTLDLISVRLMPGRRVPELRYQQAMKLLRATASSGRSPYQIIGGDFNALPDSRTIRRIKQTYISAFEQVYQHEPVATFPTALIERDPYWSGCLDYMFVSSAVTVEGIELFGRHSHAGDPTLFMSHHLGLLGQVTFPTVEI